MVIHRMKPDGACLFRAVGNKLYIYMYMYMYTLHPLSSSSPLSHPSSPLSSPLLPLLSLSLSFSLTPPPKADQVYGDQEMHSVVRNHTMDYMVRKERGVVERRGEGRGGEEQRGGGKRSGRAGGCHYGGDIPRVVTFLYCPVESDCLRWRGSVAHCVGVLNIIMD